MDLRSVLHIPSIYEVFDQLIGGSRSRGVFLKQHVRVSPGQRILDIGCGPAEILSYLPSVAYVGLDPSALYIEAARRRFGSRGTFYCSAVEHISVETLGSFDIVLAKGVLHHLQDDQALKLFQLARSVLSPTGYLATYDGCFYPNQSRLEQWLLRHDRGAHVRSEEGYLNLAKTVFHQVRPRLYRDLLRVPYTHLVMECSG